ncbi:hypothetical protein BST61_g5966 [Cercospora zeina]
MGVSVGDVKAEVSVTPEAASSTQSSIHFQVAALSSTSSRFSHATCDAPTEAAQFAFSSCASGHEGAPREGISTAISANEPTIVSEDGVRTLRIRKHGSRALPVPEILDPLYLEARHKHKKPKERQTAHTSETSKPRPLTPFQVELAVNPYARALSTTVRQCSLTRTRLPMNFLFPFGLFMPRQGGSGEGTTKPHFKPLKGYGYRTVPPPGLVGHVSYVLAKNSVVQSLGGRKARRTGPWVRIADQKTKHDYAALIEKPGEGSVKPSAEWEWDDKMAENVLHILRAGVVSGLEYAHPHGLIKRVNEVEVKNASAVVRFKGTGPEDDARDLLTNEWTHVAKFDLAELCDDSERDYLMKKLGIEDDIMVVVKGLKSLKASVALGRLQNYVDN